MQQKKPLICKLHHRKTKMRSRDTYWATIAGVNGENLFTSEKYARQADASHALDLVLGKEIPAVIPMVEE